MAALSAPLLLASKSPRRAALLAAAGIRFELLDIGAVDEAPPRGPGGAPLQPAEVVERLARRKAEAAAGSALTRVVLAADTLVFLDDEILGKPSGPDEAVRMLERLSGRTHVVATGVALIGPDGAGGLRRRSGSATTEVRFRTLGADEIRAYVGGGEPLDKAGAYALQGGAAGFVTHLIGQADTVIGLPVGVVGSLLEVWGDPPRDPGTATNSR